MVAFAFIAEEGVLEQQACLLAESIRLFAGAHRNAPILVVSPRSRRRPSKDTRRRLKALGARYIELNVRSVAPEYGTSFRVHAAAIIERRMRDDVLVFLDSDMIFAGEPDLSLGDDDVAARPVDVKGMCTTGDDDPCDAYWRALCRVCGVDYADIPSITTTADHEIVKASYNGGFIVARRTAGVFQRTEKFFKRSVAAGMLPWADGAVVQAGHGFVSGRGARLWGSSQACLSMATWGAGKSVRLLPTSHNFPAHNSDYVARAGMKEPLIAVHYHHLFGEDGDMSLHRRLNLPAACHEWLDQRLPLHA